MRLDLPAEIEQGHLSDYERKFQKGDRSALFAAIRFCFNQEILPPEWVVSAFFKATNEWYSLSAKTLDEAFGVSFPKGAQLNALRKRRRLKFAVFNAVQDAKDAGHTAIDDELFEAIGKPLGLGKTLVKEYYAAAKREMGFKDDELGRKLIPKRQRRKI